jgi:hypothetical protein
MNYEMAIAEYGDWIDNIAVHYTTHFVMNKNYIFIQKIEIDGQVYELHKINSSDYYILGCFVNKPERTKLGIIDEIKFACIANIELTKKPDMLGLTNIYNVDGVKVAKTQQGTGIGLALYKTLLKRNLVLLGDENQYLGARKLWAKLSRTDDIVVHIIDLNTKQIIENDAIILQGIEDESFDDRVWSYTDEKKHIRLIAHIK